MFYARNTVKLDGGMQYFDSPEPGLAAYGHSVFFFTTAAASQYESLYGKKAAARSFLDWMMRNANSYGLMPERILPDDSGFSLLRRCPGAARSLRRRCCCGVVVNRRSWPNL